MKRRIFALGALAALLALTGCSLLGLGRQGRTLDVEIRILSQSAFNGEIEPCG